MSSEPTLSLGDTSPDGWVEYLQQLLYAHDAVSGIHFVSGVFDQTVFDAVKAFQGQHQPPLLVDGIVGDQTWAALRNSYPTAPATDGRDPHTFVEHGIKLRFGETAPGPWRADADQIVLMANSVGDVAPDPGTVSVFIHVERDGQKVFEADVKDGNWQSIGQGGEVYFTASSITNHEAGHYKVIAQLPMETGGDTAMFEFDRT